MTVAHCDCGIAILFLHHQLSHGFAHNVATAKNDTFLAGCLDAVTLQQGDDAQWGGRDKAGKTNGHPAHIDGMETVNILAVIHSHDDFLLVNMAGQRQLHDIAIHIIICIEFLYLGKKFFFAHGVVKTNERTLEATCLAGKHLVLDIGLAATIVAYKYSSQMGAFASLGHNVVHFFSYFRLDLLGGGFSIDNLHSAKH